MFLAGVVGIVEPDALHRAIAQRLDTARGHHLDRHAAIEIGRVGFPFLEFGLVAVDQALVEGEILLLGHRTVDVITVLIARRRALVPARLDPALAHVDAIAVHDRRDGIEESEPVLPGGADNAFCQSLRGQRASGDDRRPFGGQSVHPFAHHGDIGMFFQRALHLGGKDVAVDRHGRTRGDARDFAGPHNDAVEPAHFVMQQSDRVLGIVVRTEAVRTDQFGQTVGLVRWRHLAAAAHFGQPHLEAALRQLPGRLAACEAATDYVDIMGHRARPSACMAPSTRPSVVRCRIAPLSSTGPGCWPASSPAYPIFSLPTIRSAAHG